MAHCKYSRTDQVQDATIAGSGVDMHLLKNLSSSRNSVADLQSVSSAWMLQQPRRRLEADMLHYRGGKSEDIEKGGVWLWVALDNSREYWDHF